MKIKELKDKLNYSDKHDEDELVIKLSIPSIGPVAMSKVEGVYFGFDWEKGKVLIEPETRLSEKTQPEEVYHMSRDLMMYLATKPLKKETYEVSQARKILLKTGITEEDLKKYQSFFHRV